MSFRKMKLNNESGFSLVELMVVVAIIGILAAMSVGQIGKQVAKARQSEVKANLANVYTAEKTFQGEFGTYWEAFGPIGFGVEGTVRYNVGFNGGLGVAAVPAGYTGQIPKAQAAQSFLGVGAGNGFCGTNSAAGVAPACTVITTNGVAPESTATAGGTALTNTTFTAVGSAMIFRNNLGDRWTINNNKTLTNTQDGIN